MEFNKKLQTLRKQKGLTQEELASALFVSRTAVSKWESAKGYPNIDSLKAIAKLFSVTVDELISSDELLTLAESKCKQNEKHTRELVFGLLDTSFVLLLFLPIFRHGAGEALQSATLFSLTQIAPYLRAAYFTAVIAATVFGILTLALQNLGAPFWVQNGFKISLILNVLSVALFIVSMQPYAAALSFLFLIIKALLLIKKK